MCPSKDYSILNWIFSLNYKELYWQLGYCTKTKSHWTYRTQSIKGSCPQFEKILRLFRLCWQVHLTCLWPAFDLGFGHMNVLQHTSVHQCESRVWCYMHPCDHVLFWRNDVGRRSYVPMTPRLEYPEGTGCLGAGRLSYMLLYTTDVCKCNLF